MGQKTNNLQTFNVNKDNIKEDLISLFDMDEDFNGGNGDEYWEFGEEVDEEGNPISLAVLEGFKPLYRPTLTSGRMRTKVSSA